MRTVQNVLTIIRAFARGDVTISGGLAVYSDQMDFDQLVKRADEALYKAKEDGRDRYVLATAC